jgi:HEAT repeat protein
MAASVHDRLTALLRDDPVPGVRAEAARALAATHDVEALDQLVAALDDGSEPVRRAATLALGRIRDERAASVLIDILRSRPELWREAVAALATAGDASTVERLVELLGSDSVEVRRGAVRAIAAVTAPARGEQGALFEYTDDEGHRHPLF